MTNWKIAHEMHLSTQVRSLYSFTIFKKSPREQFKAKGPLSVKIHCANDIYTL